MLIPSARHSSCFAKICLISLLAMRENISWCWIIFSLLLRSNDDYGVLKWCNWIFFTHSKTTFSTLQRADCVHACSYHEYTKWIPEIIATSSRSYFILLVVALSLFPHSFSCKRPQGEGRSKNIINYGNGEVELSVGTVMRKGISLVFFSLSVKIQNSTTLSSANIGGACMVI